MVRANPSEHTQVVRSLCKTYLATTQKLLYSFSALSEQSKAEGPASVSAAMLEGARHDSLEEIATTLASGVEKVILSGDVSLRSSVLRGLRARFQPPQKAESAEQSTQASPSGRSVEHFPQLAASEAAPSAAATPPAPPTPPAAASLPSLAAAAPLASAPRRAGLPAGYTQWVHLKPPSDVQPIQEAEQAPESEAAAAPVGAAVNVAMFERMKAWETRKAARLEGERRRKEEQEAAELAAPPKRRSKQFSHVVSALRLERENEEERKTALAEQRAREAGEAREALERRLMEQSQKTEKITLQMHASEQARAQVEAELQTARAQLEERRREAERLRAENERGAETRELLEALDGRSFEEWPMVPGRKVLRVHDSTEFDGRVSAEYRVKDVEGGERGVSLLMGRSVTTRQPEVQCVLFDPHLFSDIEAARWWVSNRHRLQKRVLRAKPTPALTQRLAEGGAQVS